jgi:hypothetical protein
MPASTIRVEGARELRSALKKAGDDASDLKDVHREVGDIVVGEAKAIGPKRSGRLTGSGRATKNKTSATVKFGGGGIPYAGVIHFGWAGHNIEPNPFVYDALDHRRAEVLERYEAGVKKITDQI